MLPCFSTQDCVVEELRCGHAFQLLRALDVVTQSVKIVKVLSRSLVDDEVIWENIEWLRRGRSGEIRCVVCPFDVYFIFFCGGVSMIVLLATPSEQFVLLAYYALFE